MQSMHIDRTFMLHLL